MVKEYFKYACLFGGGAIRGLSYVGALKAMNELGIVPQTLAGTSVGSIIAALLAVGYNCEEIKDIFFKVNFELFKDIQLGIGPKFALSKGEVFLEWVRELIEQKFYGENYKKGANKAVTFRDIDKELAIITTDLSNFECKEFSRQETPDFEVAKAVRISSGMPGLMKPVEYNNTLLVDGDLQKSWPMWKLCKHLVSRDERILEFRLEGLLDDNNMNALDYANAVYSCMTSMATSFIASIYSDCDKYDYIVLNTGNTIVVDFNIPADKREELAQSGYEQTMYYFTKVMPRKKRNLKEKYEILSKYFTKIAKYLSCKKIVKAKITLGEMYIDLCEMTRIIDDGLYQDIKNFTLLFTENIKYPSLFGRISLKNEKLVIAKLTDINLKLKNKKNEAAQYLSDFPI